MLVSETKATILKLPKGKGEFGWACWTFLGAEFLFRGAPPPFAPPSCGPGKETPKLHNFTKINLTNNGAKQTTRLASRHLSLKVDEQTKPTGRKPTDRQE